MPPCALANGRSIARNQFGVLRKITEVFERQLCGYWCFSFPRATSVTRLDKGVNDRLVGVASFAFVIDNALAFEARRLVGKRSVLIHGVGNTRIDASLLEQPRAGRPKLEVFAPVAGGGVERSQCPRLPSHGRHRAKERRSHSHAHEADARKPSRQARPL